ncbi:alpha/beta hydrolase [Phormidium tenue FACHB-886]|nr:alpha/beta hydrolase [Phormidium tenue FACHB-886]
MQLQDGRVLAWSEWGSIEGLPVLFCTAAATSGSLGFGANDLPELGLRLIAVDRPGLGASDPHPSKTLSSWVTDICELIQLNHLHLVTAVGFPQGAVFALALAAEGIVESVAIVSGQDELVHSCIRPLLHADVRQMIAAVEQDATAFKQYVSQSATWEQMWQFIISLSAERDHLLYLAPSFSQAFQRGLQEGFAQGAQGYARDLVDAVRSWSFAVEDIKIPVDLWYGGLDTSTVHSPDFGTILASRLPRATHTIDSNEGGSIL